MYKRIFFALAFLCSHLHGFAQAAMIDSIVKAEMKRQHIIGLSLGIVRNYQVFMQKGYGVEDLLDAGHADENTVYMLGSLSKQFIATAIMQLAEEQKLDLSDHISKYISTAPDSWDGITIRMLLNHTSGLERESPLAMLTEASLAKKYPDSLVIQCAYYDTLLSAPGTKWSYSNLGYFILADIIRKVSGHTFADYMNDLFSSQGLTHTSTTDKTGPGHRAKGYTYNEQTGGHNVVPDIQALRPSSAFTSTVSDLLKWDSIQRNGYLLSNSNWARMYEDGVLAMGSDTDKHPMYYGYGWEVVWQNDHRLVRHGGNPYGGGFTSDYWRFVMDNISIIILANATTADLDKICYKISVALDPDLKETMVAVPDADKYTGVYSNKTLKMKITVTNDDGVLTGQATGQPSYPMKSIGNDNFTYTPAGIEMDFLPAENTFILKQHGLEYTFTKK